jgi:cytochrome P450
MGAPLTDEARATATKLPSQKLLISENPWADGKSSASSEDITHLAIPATASRQNSDADAPSGPGEPYRAGHDLLHWIGGNFARFGDTFSASIFGTHTLVTRSPQIAHHVLVSNWRNYRKGQIIKRVGLLLGHGLMVSEGELWKSQRQRIQPAFHRNAIAAMAPIITRSNLALRERWLTAAATGAAINVTADVSRLALEVILKCLFGEDRDYDDIAPDFAVLCDDRTRSLQFADKFRTLAEPVLAVIERRRAAPVAGIDILATLMAARDRDTGEPMPQPQLVNEILTLVVAGHETTVSTLAWIWYLLSQHPEIDNKLGDELAELSPDSTPELGGVAQFTYARQVIEEAMRVFPPGWLVTRRALGNDRLGNYAIVRGAEVYLPLYFIQRHPGWRAPDSFRPDRFGEPPEEKTRFAMLPFSAGFRNCIGEGLARLEMQLHLIIIAQVLRMRLVSSGRSSSLPKSTCVISMIL